jgi:hypothetical protein
VSLLLLLLLLYPCFVMPVVKRVDAAVGVGVVQMSLPLLLLLLTMIVRGWNGPDWMMLLLL